MRPLRATRFVDLTGTDSESELDEVAGGEALVLDADCADAVSAVAADLFSIVYDEDQQLPLFRVAEGIELDRASPDSALHGVIVDGDLETVRSSESYELDRRALLP